MSAIYGLTNILLMKLAYLAERELRIRLECRPLFAPLLKSYYDHTGPNSPLLGGEVIIPT